MKQYWVKIPMECTCDDNPYADACDFCLVERGIKKHIVTEDYQMDNEFFDNLMKISKKYDIPIIINGQIKK